jgi:hypothetical protein
MVAIGLMRFKEKQFAEYSESPKPEVNLLVEQGNHMLQGKSPDSIQRARECFKSAISLDSRYPPAYYGLFGTYVYEGGMEPNGSQEARQAVRQVAATLMELIQIVLNRFPCLPQSNGAHGNSTKPWLTGAEPRSCVHFPSGIGRGRTVGTGTS